MVKTYAYGFPRIGKNREYKKTIESFWKEKITENELLDNMKNLEDGILNTYRENVDWYPTNEMTLYDKMFDMAILLGKYDPKNLNEYYDLCRGENALEMTKWFNTNYHYLVSDFSDWDEPKFKHNKNFSTTGDNPHLIGPFTFLKLSKGIPEDKFEEFILQLAKIYKEIIDDYTIVHIDEPAFTMDITTKEVNLIKKVYEIMSKTRMGTKINVFTYYEDVTWIKQLIELPVNGIGLDLINGKDNLRNLEMIKFPKDKILFAGFVDGINVWKSDLNKAILSVEYLSKSIDKIYVTNAGPLYHLPITLENENDLPIHLYENLSFATEKFDELKHLKDGNRSYYKRYYGQVNEGVNERVNNLTDEDFVKSLDVVERRKLQDEILNLPELPTTTIGSFPQTKEVRKNRLDYKKGRISEEDYQINVSKFIKESIDIQEEIGMDVLVHGEPERSDMVEHFCQRLDGMTSTDNGWIISYGTRVYRPSIIHGDVSRPKSMTVTEISYAQTLTDKPVKGMLTGAVTIMAWDYVRKDIPIQNVAYQIGLALQDEIKDYEKAGIKIVQVDEPAFRELVPIKKKYHREYFDWAIKSYNLSTNTSPETQIHCHMCYSEFNEIVNEINQLDFDVVSIECSRSKGEIIEAFESIDFKRQIGLGVWDIHSPAVPTVDDMSGILNRALKVIPKNQFWINPDCGLKTRGWTETKESMKNMVDAKEVICQ